MAFFSSRKTPIYLALAIVLVIGVFFQLSHDYVSRGIDSSFPTVVIEHSQPNLTSSEPALKSAELTKTDEKPTHTQQLSNAPKSVEKSLTAPDAWSVGDTNSTLPKMPLPAGVSVYEPVLVDMENPKYPEPGEQRTMTMPGGERLQVNVENKATNPNGDYTWRGHLDGHGDDYPVVMTYGNNSVFATVTTPKGSYTLVSVNGSGWIYKNPSEFELSKPGVNDSLEIPHPNK